MAIELALRLEKLLLMGFKDGLEFNFIAICFGASRRLWRCREGFEMGADRLINTSALSSY
jgi:hypothetical protein